LTKKRGEPWDAPATRLLQAYADRGVFRGPLSETRSAQSVRYRVRWHRNREFDLILDRARHNARALEVLPSIPARSPMYREFKEFLASFQDGSRPKHRSVDAKKVEVKPVNRSGSVSIRLNVRNGDYAYAIEKLLTLIHETYLGFLNGPYDHYRVEALGADPDWGR
jgi:hypothetical protein